jgi:hypothetical protein
MPLRVRALADDRKIILFLAASGGDDWQRILFVTPYTPVK